MTVHLLMLGAFAVSIALAVGCILCLRLLRERQERRSPLRSRQIGHVPGQQLVERVADSQENMLLAVILMYFAFPVMLLAWALQRVPPDRLRIDGTAWVYLLGALGMFVLGLRSFLKHLKARQKARDGLLAERVTGMQLNRLVAQGCTVMHDVPSDTGNIDHVVIAPRGVYAVETKSLRKPRNAGELRNDPGHQVQFDGARLDFPDFSTSKPIEQAMRHADWLRRHLRQCIGQDVPVIAAVALPGWFVVQEEEIWRNAPVKVFTPMKEGANFITKDIQRIGPEHRALIATAIAQRYPVVSD